VSIGIVPVASSGCERLCPRVTSYPRARDLRRVGGRAPRRHRHSRESGFPVENSVGTIDALVVDFCDVADLLKRSGNAVTSTRHVTLSAAIASIDRPRRRPSLDALREESDSGHEIWADDLQTQHAVGVRPVTGCLRTRGIRIAGRRRHSRISFERPEDAASPI